MIICLCSVSREQRGFRGDSLFAYLDIVRPSVFDIVGCVKQVFKNSYCNKSLLLGDVS